MRMHVKVRGAVANGLKPILMVTLLLTAAHAQAPPARDTPGTVVSTRLIKVLPASQADEVFSALKDKPGGFPSRLMADAREKLGPALYAVKLMQIIYCSHDFYGAAVKVSGLVMEPETGHANPVISYQHGTLYQSKQGPSLFEKSYEAVLLYRICAVRGYTVLMPDYVGIGIAGNGPQNFIISKVEAANSADLMTAYESYSGHAIPQLFLAGYSQGGHATAATHIFLQKSGQRKVAACALMSGGYDLSRSFAYWLDPPVVPKGADITLWGQSCLAMFVTTYNRFYFPDTPVNAIYDPAYVKLIKLWDDPNPSIEEIVRDFSGKPLSLLRSDFIRQFGGYAGTLHRFMIENSVLYVPDCPTRLYHSANDTLVMPGNSEEQYLCMKAGGARDVEMHILPDLPDHHDATLPEIVMASLWFDQFSKR